jgi:hypothetical protein
MSSLLKRVPNVELITHDEANQQYGFKNGILRGHYDGVINGIRGLSTWAIWEHKATNEKNFNKLVKLASNLEHMALQQWNPVYYAQAVVNMHHEKLDYHYMTVSTAGLRDYTSVLTEANPTFAEGLITKANRLATMKEPPQKIGGKDYFGCKMCCFYEVCHA